MFWVARANTQWAGVGAVRMQPQAALHYCHGNVDGVVVRGDVSKRSKANATVGISFVKNPFGTIWARISAQFLRSRETGRAGSSEPLEQEAPFSRAACSDDSQLADMSIHFW